VAWYSELNPRRFFLDTWREIDIEAADCRGKHAGSQTYDFRPLIALCFGAMCLVLLSFFGNTRHFYEFGEWAAVRNDLAAQAWGAMRASQWHELAGFVWWSAWRMLGYMLIPAVLIRYVWHLRIRDYGLATTGIGSHARIYLLAYFVVLICIVVVTFLDARFSAYYPMYRLASRSWVDFWAWELLYVSQFFALEFFFRGFWLNALKPALGSQAIFVMVVPYCMIHLGKPLPEALAAIAAGIFLGTLAMKTRSIWGGFLVHAAVAVTMDVGALLATRRLPDSWWPG